jgi:predicted PurR-regulated permease PerM
LADRLERLGMNRTLASLLIVAVVSVVLILIALLIVPLLLQQAIALASSLPGYVARMRELLAGPSMGWLGAGDQSKIGSEVVAYLVKWLGSFAPSLWSGGRALISFVSVIIIMPIVTFYLICDWHGMMEILDSWVPVRHRETVRELAREIDKVISGFLLGQFGLSLFLCIYYSLALTFVGLQFGAVIGLGAGLLTFIPYIGSMIGLLIGTAVAIAQFWPHWQWIAAVVAIFLLGQFIEGNILWPKLLGDRVGLHPIWVIFAMFAFGYLFGSIGLLLGVPIAAAIGVLFRFGVRRYLASPLYTGERTP